MVACASECARSRSTTATSRWSSTASGRAVWTCRSCPARTRQARSLEVGPGVSRVEVGDRVASTVFQRWLNGHMLSTPPLRSVLAGSLDGVLADRVVLHEDGLVHVPEHLSDEEAATLPCAGVTAWNALVTKGRVRPGQTILVQGTGGVSIFALQFGLLAGVGRSRPRRATRSSSTFGSSVPGRRSTTCRPRTGRSGCSSSRG